jgi:hypothetical protein
VVKLCHWRSSATRSGDGIIAHDAENDGQRALGLDENVDKGRGCHFEIAWSLGDKRRPGAEALVRSTDGGKEQGGEPLRLRVGFLESEPRVLVPFPLDDEA